MAGGAAAWVVRTHPYRQSERLEIYREHTDKLLASGKAYRCFCTQEELEAERLLATKEHRPQVYSGAMPVDLAG